MTDRKNATGPSHRRKVCWCCGHQHVNDPHVEFNIGVHVACLHSDGIAGVIPLTSEQLNKLTASCGSE